MSHDCTDRADLPLKVLSAGAPKTGVSRCAEAFFRRSGQRVEIDFATAPTLRARVRQDETDADVLVAPVPDMRAFEACGLTLPGHDAVIGSIKTGVVVRLGVPEPSLATVEAFKQALLAADSLIYNRASSGRYAARLMKRLGIAEAVEAKTTRVATGAAVMRHLARSRAAKEIGFGQITEIRLHLDQGLKLVGPLPAEIGKVTTYAAGVLAAARASEAAADFVRFLGSPWAMEVFAETGVEQVR